MIYITTLLSISASILLISGMITWFIENGWTIASFAENLKESIKSSTSIKLLLWAVVLYLIYIICRVVTG